MLIKNTLLLLLGTSNRTKQLFWNLGNCRLFSNFVRNHLGTVSQKQSQFWTVLLIHWHDIAFMSSCFEFSPKFVKFSWPKNFLPVNYKTAARRWCKRVGPVPVELIWHIHTLTVTHEHFRKTVWVFPKPFPEIFLFIHPHHSSVCVSVCFWGMWGKVL